MILASCSKEDDQQEFSNSQSNSGVRIVQTNELELYNQLLSIEKSIDQRATFEVLSPSQKLQVWQTKYNQLLRNGELNTDQQNFINRFSSELIADYFVPRSEKNKIFQAYKLGEYIDEALLLFNDLETYNLFFDLTNDLDCSKKKLLQNEPLNLDSSSDKVHIKSCTCARESRYSCGRLTGMGAFQISVEYGSCEGKKCVQSNWGCGGLYTSICDGAKCKFKQEKN